MGKERSYRHEAAPTDQESSTKPKADMEMVRQALSVLVPPEAVVELRIPNVPRQGTVSGYFSDPRRLAESAAAMSGKSEGVYLTSNPVNPDLLARAWNRLVSLARHTTGDHDVIRRLWFLIDFDPLRPAGISSTDAEHEAALERARQCREWLRARGWPEPILADSGNGAHLLYLVDLPNDDLSTEMLQSCLEALAFRFDDTTVAVDSTTYNAARLLKVYGTLAAKGDNLPERPHRLAHLLDVPADRVPVAVELLRAPVASIPKVESPVQHQGKGARLDVARWIADHHLEAGGPTDWKGARRWVLRVCLWNQEHRRSAFILEFPTGAIAAGCLDKSFAGRGWDALRDAVEPGWRNRCTAEGSLRSGLPAVGVLASEVKLESVDWLWRERIPLRKLSILEGDPGLGKSTVTIDLAARITTGKPMPDGSLSRSDPPGW